MLDEITSGMKRRSLLASLGLGMAVGSAGCIEFAADTFDNSSSIGWIGVSNYDTTPHQFEVQVERDGTLVHESSHRIQERDDSIAHGDALDCTWGNTAGTYRVRARIDGNDWIGHSVDDAIDGTVGCVTVRVTYGDIGGGLDIFVRENCEAVPEYSDGCEFAND